MSNRHKKHKVVFYNWIEGILKFEEYIADSLEHASHLIKHHVCHEAKIYDIDGILVHAHCDKKDHDSYA